MPEVSVIIPLYNKEKDILHTLESLRKQTFSQFEAIVVNDGSTDSGVEIVKTFGDPRIRIFDKKNEGVARTRNLGVNKATAPLIAFLDADDFWYPNHLQNLIALSTSFPQGKWFATAYEKKHTPDFTTAMISPLMKKHPWQGEVPDYFANSLTDALAWTSAVAMKKDFFLALRGFDATITNGAGEDTDLWLRAALESPLIFTTEISATHNLIGSNRISFTPTKKRVFMNPDKYEATATHYPSLKKYLDVNRFSFALQHKLAGDSKTFHHYRNTLNPENLNQKQRFLLKQPRWVLIMLKKLKRIMENMGVRITAFERKNQN